MNVEIWVLVDEDGNAVVEQDRDTLKERYESDIGDLPPCTRLVKVTVHVDLPEVVELAGTAPAAKGSAQLLEVKAD